MTPVNTNDKKNSTKSKVVLIIIILLIIYVILNLIKIPWEIEKKTTQTPKISNQTHKEIDTITSYDCVNISYIYDEKWLDWMPEKNNEISPAIQIINLHNEPGIFEVYFAFFDNEIYDYNDFHNIEYEKIKDKLSWNSASMFSKKTRFSIAPKEKKIVYIYTLKLNSDKVYWAYADITAPTYKSCSPIIDKQIIKKTTNYKTNFTSIENTIEYISLWDFLLLLLFH